MLKIAFLDSNALIAYYKKDEHPAHENMQEFIQNRLKNKISVCISEISIGECLNTLKNRIKGDKDYLEFAVWDLASKLSGVFRPLPLPGNSGSPGIRRLKNIWSDTRRWAKESPTDAFLAAIIRHYFTGYPGNKHDCIFVSCDKRFVIAMRKEGYVVYNPSEKSYTEFIKGSNS